MVWKPGRENNQPLILSYSFMKCSSIVLLVHESASDSSLRFLIVYLYNMAVDLYVFISCSVALLKHWTFTIIGLASLWFSTVYTGRFRFFQIEDGSSAVITQTDFSGHGCLGRGSFLKLLLMLLVENKGHWKLNKYSKSTWQSLDLWAKVLGTAISSNTLGQQQQQKAMVLIHIKFGAEFYRTYLAL